MADEMTVKAAARASIAGLALTGLLAGCGVGMPNSLRTYKQTGPSMEPAIQIGDVLTRSPVGTPYRGEVVLVKSEVDPNASGGGLLIKRIVGLPGDKVALTDSGALTINGTPLPEPYLAAGTVTGYVSPLRVPAGNYYLLGDNRDASSDSRIFGPVSRKELVGSTHRIVLPTKHAGRIRGT